MFSRCRVIFDVVDKLNVIVVLFDIGLGNILGEVRFFFGKLSMGLFILIV